MRPTIALLTDFGYNDGYVAAMKAVILAIQPTAGFLDITHGISPGDIRHGAFELWRIRPFLPAAAIVVAVVDPGVGSARKAVAIEFAGLRCVGPDNGIFSLLLQTEADRSSFDLNQPAFWAPEVSSTFHGRDIFAPVAAHLAGGVSITDMGQAGLTPLELPPPRLAVAGPSAIEGEILHVDHFGNLITSIGRLYSNADQLRYTPWLGERPAIESSLDRVRIQVAGSQELGLSSSFASVPPGTLLAYIGSSGLLEIAANGESAAHRLGQKRGDPVTMNL